MIGGKNIIKLPYVVVIMPSASSSSLAFTTEFIIEPVIGVLSNLSLNFSIFFYCFENTVYYLNNGKTQFEK